MMLDLKSTDLNRFKFTEENVVKLKGVFPHLDDETLARYLIAQNNDLEGASKKLVKAEELKSEYWHIKKSQCIGEIKTGTAYLNGFDREGRPVLVILARLHDAEKRNLQEMILMTLWWTEQALARLPADKSQFVILLDRDNCENALDTEYLQKVAEIFQDLHPERLHKAIVYPTGLVYYSMWNLVLKWFMEEHTRSKVVPAITLNDVFDLVEDKYVPASLGGKSAYQFNIDDFSDPVYAEDMGNSPSGTTLESLYSAGPEDRLLPFVGSPKGTESIHPPGRILTAQVSNATHTTVETPLSDARSFGTAHGEAAASPPAPARPAEQEGGGGEDDLLEFNFELDSNPVHPPLPLLPLTIHRTPEKAGPRSIEEQLAALQSETLPLEGAEAVVGEGNWQEYLEYERSQHNSPTGPATNSQAHELFSPDTVYAASSGDEEKEEEDVWNDVDSVSSRLSLTSAQAAAVLRQQLQSLPPRPQPVVPSSIPSTSRHVGNGTSGSVAFESYHNNASPVPQTATFAPVQLADITAAHARAEEEEVDPCVELWHEVASVASFDSGESGEVSPLSPLTPGNFAENRIVEAAGSSAISRHPFDEVPADRARAPTVARGPTTTGSVGRVALHRSSSAPALLGSPKIHPTVAAYARIGTFVVFVSGVIVVVAAVLYGIYSPASLAPSVPLTVLAQLVLLLMLLFSFL